jgi:hypothetical protein
LERKFESELGRSIARGEARHFKKTSVIVTAVVACALMFGSAAFLLPALAQEPLQLNKPVTWIEVNEGTQYDFAVFEQDEDPMTEDALLHYSDPVLAPDNFEVKRSMNLKVTDFDQPNSPDAGIQYNKFVYSMGVNVQSLDNVGSWDGVVGSLSIPYTIVDNEDEIDVTPTILVNGEAVTNGDIVSYDYVEGYIVVTVELGSYSVVEWVVVVEGEEPVPTTVEKSVVSGDYISIQVLVKVPFYEDIVDQEGELVDGALERLALDEEAFPGLDDWPSS